MRDTTLRYAVLRFGNDWRIVDSAGRYGRFASASEAAAYAGLLAREARGMGYEVELLVQSPIGELRYANVEHTVH